LDDKKTRNEEVPPNGAPRGRIVVYCSRVNISKDTFKAEKQYDLNLRFEHVHHELDNIFAEFSCKNEKCVYKDQRYLYVCGYLDNTIKIFDLKKKSGEHLVHQLRHNNARVTCIKFSKDYKYFITCDADGVIQHYEKNCHMTDHADIDGALNTTVGDLAMGQGKRA
jgi:WD40 repeat protein